MKPRLAILLALAVATGWGQVRRPFPSRFASRGLRGAVAAGSENATEAGMRMFLAGGNAVDAGIATMLAASVVEFSHFGLGGEAPILVRTKEGKVFAIAGVGTMPKLGTADFYRKHTLTPLEIDDPPGPNGLKAWVPVVGILSALVPGMVDAAIVTERDFGTKSFAEVLQPAIELADGFPLDEFRALLAREQRAISCGVAQFEARLPPERRALAGRQHFSPARLGAHPAQHGRRGEESPGRGRFARSGHGSRARLFLPRRYRPPHRRILEAKRWPAALRGHGGIPRGSRKKRSPPPSTATRSTSPVSGARARP